MNLNEMWKLFRKRKLRFMEVYVAYHYFRSKGWVVRFGNMYGADLGKRLIRNYTVMYRFQNKYHIILSYWDLSFTIRRIVLAEI